MTCPLKTSPEGVLGSESTGQHESGRNEVGIPSSNPALPQTRGGRGSIPVPAVVEGGLMLYFGKGFRYQVRDY